MSNCKKDGNVILDDMSAYSSEIENIFTLHKLNQGKITSNLSRRGYQEDD